MVVGVLVAAVFVFKHTTTYTSSASIWVDTPAQTASTVGADANTASTTPAASEQGLLSELLTTRAFASEVASDSVLGRYLRGNTAAAAAQLEHGQVVVTVVGPQVVQVSYKGPTPEVTRGALSAILTNLEQSSTGLFTTRDRAAVAYDRSQVQAIGAQVTSLRNQIGQYQRQHPGATAKSDPVLGALTTSESSAGTQYALAAGNLSQALADHSGGSWSVHVVDPPGAPIASVQGKKVMIETLIAGLFGGFLVSLLGAMILTPSRVDRWEDELPMAPTTAGASGNGNGSTVTPPAPATAPQSDEVGLPEKARGVRLSSVRQIVLRQPGDDSEDS